MTTGTRVFHPTTASMTDWQGRLIDPAVQEHFAVGNVVRVQVEQDVDGGWIETPYVRITEVTDDGLFGVVDEPDRSEDREVLNGDVFSFRRGDVIEIPTEWPGNHLLIPHVRLTGDTRMTGLLGHD